MLCISNNKKGKRENEENYEGRREDSKNTNRKNKTTRSKLNFEAGRRQARLEQCVCVHVSCCMFLKEIVCA